LAKINLTAAGKTVIYTSSGAAEYLLINEAGLFDEGAYYLCSPYIDLLF